MTSAEGPPVGLAQAIAVITVLCQAVLLHGQDPALLAAVAAFEAMTVLAGVSVRRDLELGVDWVAWVSLLGPSWVFSLMSLLALGAARRSWLVAAAGLVGVCGGALGHSLVNPGGRAPAGVSPAYRGYGLMPLGCALHGSGVVAVVAAGRSGLPVIPAALLVVALGAWATLVARDEAS